MSDSCGWLVSIAWSVRDGGVERSRTTVSNEEKLDEIIVGTLSIDGRRGHGDR